MDKITWHGSVTLTASVFAFLAGVIFAKNHYAPTPPDMEFLALGCNVQVRRVTEMTTQQQGAMWVLHQSALALGNPLNPGYGYTITNMNIEATIKWN